jgi:hypothetical protein
MQVGEVVHEECGEGGVVVDFRFAGPGGAGFGAVGTSILR